MATKKMTPQNDTNIFDPNFTLESVMKPLQTIEDKTMTHVANTIITKIIEHIKRTKITPTVFELDLENILIPDIDPTPIEYSLDDLTVKKDECLKPILIKLSSKQKFKIAGDLQTRGFDVTLHDFNNSSYNKFDSVKTSITINKLQIRFELK